MELFGLLHDRYLLRAYAGAGYFGTVWKADDTYLCRPVAIKEIPLKPETGLTTINDPLYEARMLAALRHPHILEVHDIFREKGNYYLVMQWVEGKPLHLFRQEVGGIRHPFPLGLFFRGALQLCRVLRFLHERMQPLIFRDLKPANIMVDTSGQQATFYLVDMGAVIGYSPTATCDAEECFTPGYVAPEIERSSAPSSPVTDVYSYSVTLAEWLLNRRLVWFDSEVDLDLPALPDLVDLLRAGMAPDPRQRPQSMWEVEQHLRRISRRVQGEVFVECEQGAPQVYSVESCPFYQEVPLALVRAGGGGRR